ncbi:MAG: 50S ribosomal protein L13 [Deltaproteobacteria bacterium]|nr:50S ribosomal protein L13 [Deltaproteobacteria bacterium]|tara:strand:- start:14470 stop:14904 length:435 start_codon:yes stop_codon:yes gene_type:complete
MKTYMPNKDKAHEERKWFLFDVNGKVLGRQATEIASILRGKHKPEYTPFLDCGDFVVVVNAEKVELTGRKWDQKVYYRHSNYPGGIKEMTAREMNEKRPERMLYLAVKNMLPKGSLGRQMLKKLKIYAGEEHPHQAQNPEPVEL